MSSSDWVRIFFIVCILIAIGVISYSIQKEYYAPSEKYCNSLNGHYRFQLGDPQCTINTIPYYIIQEKEGSYLQRR